MNNKNNPDTKHITPIKAYMMYSYMTKKNLGATWTTDGQIITLEQVITIINQNKK